MSKSGSAACNPLHAFTLVAINLLAVNPERYSDMEFNVKNGNPEHYSGDMIIIVFITLITPITRSNCHGMPQITGPHS